MIGSDRVDNETSLGHRTTPLFSLKSADKSSNRKIFAARENEITTFNCHREDFDFTEMAWESEVHGLGPCEQNIMHSVTSPHEDSEDKACAWVYPIVPQSNLRRPDILLDSFKVNKSSNLLNIVSQSTITETLPLLIQAQPHPDDPHQGCSNKGSEHSKLISLTENDAAHESEGVKGEDNTNLMIQKINYMLHPEYSVLETASELELPRNHKPFCWSSSKLIVFINGKAIDMSVSVPKYIPKNRKSKRYRRRKLAMKHATAIYQINMELTTTNDHGSSNLRFKVKKENEKSTRMSRPSRLSQAKTTQLSEHCLSITEGDTDIREKAAASVPVLKVVRRGGHSRRINTEFSHLVNDTTRIDNDVRNHSHAQHIKETLTKDENLLKQRQEAALRFLKTASDFGSMQAALDIFHDLHSDIELHKDAKALLEQATVAIPYLMHSAMMKFLTIPRKDGGPELSVEEARKLTMDLYKHMGPECCDENVNESDLVRIGGLPKIEAHRLLPHLLRVAKTVSDEYKEMQKELFSLESEQILLAKIWPPKSEGKSEIRSSTRKRQWMCH